MSANPNPIVAVQPDGQEIQLRFKGGAEYSWHEDLNGFPVIYVDGLWVYQTSPDPSAARLSTTLEVGKVDPKAAGVKQISRFERSLYVKPGARHFDYNPSTVQTSLKAANGVVPNLVVMIRFADHTARTLPSRDDIDVLFNHVGPHALAPSGSIRDVYLENSYGQMLLNSTVLDWITLSGTEAYYADGKKGLNSVKLSEGIKEALTIADLSVDFTDFDLDGDGVIDAFTIMHSGYAAETGGVDQYGGVVADRIWSHKGGLKNSPWYSAEGVEVLKYSINPGVWSISGSEIGRIGVISHEIGHFFGLLDFYDTDKSGSGIGNWGLMANSWGWDQSQYYPPHFSAYAKVKLGWVAPTNVVSTGSFSAGQVQTNPDIFKITTGFPDGEYLLLENRQKVGFDQQIQGPGLLIFHIDEARAGADQYVESYPGQSNWPSDHYRIAVLQSDGTYALEKGLNQGNEYDTYSSTYKSEIGPSTVPNTDSYQGTAYSTGIVIKNISASGPVMTFDVVAAPPAPSFLYPIAEASLASGDSVSVEYDTNGANPVEDDTRLEVGSSCQVPVPWAEDEIIGDNQWAIDSSDANFSWGKSSSNSYNGSFHWRAVNAASATDQTLTTDEFKVPRLNPELRFWHHYNTEPNFDGGVVELSTYGGAWRDLSTQMIQMGYNGTISTNYSNPLAGLRAFTGDSLGYVETVVDLSAFSEQDVRIRFRLGTDTSVGDVGWDVDSISVSGDPDAEWTLLDNAASSPTAWTVVGAPGSNYCFRLTAHKDRFFTGLNSESVVSARFSIGPSITTPRPGRYLFYPSVDFSWVDNGTADIEHWYLSAGSSGNGAEYFVSGVLPGDQYSIEVVNLPTDLSPVEVVLSFYIDGEWQSVHYTYTAADGSLLPGLDEPAPGSTLDPFVDVFRWTDPSGTNEGWRLTVGSQARATDVFDSGVLPASEEFVAVNNLPSDGREVFVTLWYFPGGSTWTARDYRYLAADAALLPAITTPAINATLAGTSQEFAWSDNGVEFAYWGLTVGDTPGGNNYLSVGNLQSSVTSVTATGLPTDGRPIYADFNYYVLGEGFHYVRYTYTAAANPPPSMTSPVPGSTLTSSDVNFNWDDNGSVVLSRSLKVGSTPGSQDYFYSGAMTTQTSVSATGLPSDGSTVYVTFSYLLQGASAGQAIEYTYTAATAPPPSITSPVPLSTLTGSSVVFEWDDNGNDIGNWELEIGSTLGGSNHHSSGSLGDVASHSVTGLPMDGSQVYVRLWSFNDTAVSWATRDYTYTASLSELPAIVAPASGSTLSGSSVGFSWADNGTSVDDWWLYAGTVAGNKSYFNSGVLGGATSTTVTGLPVDGSTVVVTLYYRETGGTWQTVVSSYTAATAAFEDPAVTSPLANSTLPGATVQFSWADNGTPVSDWWLYAGTVAGNKSYFDSGALGGATSTTVTGLPVDGSAVAMTLYYRPTGGTWQTVVSSYTAASTALEDPAVTSPLANSTLSGATAQFSWADNGTSVDDWWLYAGPNAGSNSYFNSGALGGVTSTTVTGLPVDGSTVVTTLYYRQTGGTWQSVTSSYTAASAGIEDPSVTSPLANSTLPGATAQFSWADNGTSVDDWWLYAGTVAGSNSYFNSGALGGATSTTVTGLPVDGSAVIMTLYYRQTGGTWQTVASSYTAASAAIEDPAVTSPLANSTLPGATAQFTWADNGTSVDDWWLYAGPSAGSSSYFNSGALGGTTSVAVTGLPQDGSTVVVTLYYRQTGGSWQSVESNYNASSGGACTVPTGFTPANGSTLGAGSQLLSWNNTNCKYWVYAGSADYAGSGGGNIAYGDSGELGTQNSYTISGYPGNGSSVYVRVWYAPVDSNNYSYTDLSYTSP